jgi:hypothetical protein
MKKVRKTTRSKTLKKRRSVVKKKNRSVVKNKTASPKKKPIRNKYYIVSLRGKRYKIQKTGKISSNLWAYCTDPKFTNRLIKIHKILENYEELETLIHEMLHACFWDLDEEVISEVGRDLSKALWKMGYRKQK